MSVAAIVPTVGRSPWLASCLEALRRQGELEIILVVQGAASGAVERAAELADRVLRRDCNEGFAAANNLAIAASRSDFVATVNDDAVVEPGWLQALVTALGRSDGIAAVQGVNLRADRPELADGCGLAWNCWWQAVQIGHGQPAPSPSAPEAEIFGVSATAALYRRAALDAISGSQGRPFDEALFAYYEDVDVACRLRAAGYTARSVPSARARHAGSTTGRGLPRSQLPLIYGNRYLVLARWLGLSFWPRLPWIGSRDVVDLARALVRDRRLAAGLVRGWWRAVRGLRRYARRGSATGLREGGMR